MTIGPGRMRLEKFGQECTGPGGTSCSFSRVCLGVCVWPLADWLCYETCQSAHTRVFPIIHPCPLPFGRSSAPTSLPFLLCCHLKGQVIFPTKYSVFSVTSVYTQIHFNFKFNSLVVTTVVAVVVIVVTVVAAAVIVEVVVVAVIVVAVVAVVVAAVAIVAVLVAVLEVAVAAVAIIVVVVELAVGAVAIVALVVVVELVVAAVAIVALVVVVLVTVAKVVEVAVVRLQFQLLFTRTINTWSKHLQGTKN